MDFSPRIYTSGPEISPPSTRTSVHADSSIDASRYARYNYFEISGFEVYNANDYNNKMISDRTFTC